MYLGRSAIVFAFIAASSTAHAQPSAPRVYLWDTLYVGMPNSEIDAYLIANGFTNEPDPRPGAFVIWSGKPMKFLGMRAEISLRRTKDGLKAVTFSILPKDQPGLPTMIKRLERQFGPTYRADYATLVRFETPLQSTYSKSLIYFYRPPLLTTLFYSYACAPVFRTTGATVKVTVEAPSAPPPAPEFPTQSTMASCPPAAPYAAPAPPVIPAQVVPPPPGAPIYLWEQLAFGMSAPDAAAYLKGRGVRAALGVRDGFGIVRVEEEINYLGMDGILGLIFSNAGLQRAVFASQSRKGSSFAETLERVEKKYGPADRVDHAPLKDFGSNKYYVSTRAYFSRAPIVVSMQYGIQCYNDGRASAVISSERATDIPALPSDDVQASQAVCPTPGR